MNNDRQSHPEADEFMDQEGFLFVATKESHVWEAASSWESVQEHHPEAQACIFTDCPELAGKFFQRVCLLPEPTWTHGDKILPMAESPFAKTIFLDSDTKLVAPVEELFEMLDRWDILLARDPWGHHVEGTPPAIRQYNSGMVAFCSGKPRVKEFMRSWDCDYRELVRHRGKYIGDQYSLQKMLFESDLRWLLVSAEYNFRTVAPAYLRSGEELKILHGRQNDLTGIGKRMNRSRNTFRVFYPDLRTLAESDPVVGTWEGNLVFRSLLSPVKLYYRVIRLLSPRLRRKWYGRGGGL